MRVNIQLLRCIFYAIKLSCPPPKPSLNFSAVASSAHSAFGALQNQLTLPIQLQINLTCTSPPLSE